MGEYIFLSIVLFLVFLFIRIGIISKKAENFVKKRYGEYWQENIHCKYASGPWGGSAIFQLTKNLNDPLLQEYEKQWLRAI